MLAVKIEKRGEARLAKIPTAETGGLNKASANIRLVKVLAELSDLQELLYAAGENGLLVVVQGRDTGGKDGTMDDVAGAINPVGVRIASFKVPTPNESAHDFLWRIHAQTPGKGEAVFFNRSHYEDVLVSRVHKLVPKSVWEKRYDHIRNFEQLLIDSGIIVVKFYLHISKEEQKERLLEREKEPDKAWKLSPTDWKERAYWDKYTDAYEDALNRCSMPKAPWYIVPADHKWFRNLAVAEALVETMRPYKDEWLRKLGEIEKTQRALLEEQRKSGEIEDPTKHD